MSKALISYATRIYLNYRNRVGSRTVRLKRPDSEIDTLNSLTLYTIFRAFLLFKIRVAKYSTNILLSLVNKECELGAVYI